MTEKKDQPERVERCGHGRFCSAPSCPELAPRSDGERLPVSRVAGLPGGMGQVRQEQWRGDSYTPVRARTESMMQAPLTITVKPHPGDVIPHTLHLPARQCWPHHGQVSLAAGTGEGSRHIALLPRGVGDTQDLCVEERGNKAASPKVSYGLHRKDS